MPTYPLHWAWWPSSTKSLIYNIVPRAGSLLPARLLEEIWKVKSVNMSIKKKGSHNSTLFEHLLLQSSEVCGIFNNFLCGQGNNDYYYLLSAMNCARYFALSLNFTTTLQDFIIQDLKSGSNVA